jgi:large subunit ribosomal protein L18
MAFSKINRRAKIKRRIRKKVSGTAQLPRLTVFRSNKQIYAQLIDDTKGVTLVAASSYKNTAVEKLPKVEQAARRLKSYVQNDMFRTKQANKRTHYGR